MQDLRELVENISSWTPRLKSQKLLDGGSLNALPAVYIKPWIVPVI